MKRVGFQLQSGAGASYIRMKSFPYKWFGALLVCLLAASQSLRPADGKAPPVLAVTLGSSTIANFQRYVATTQSQNDKNLSGANFLWIDNLPDKARQEVYAALKRGEVRMMRVPQESFGAHVEIHGGMIHDWKGIVFIPGANLNQVLHVLQDYDRQAIIYAPDVEKSKLEQRHGDHYLVFLRFRRSKFVTVVLNTEHEVTYYRDSATRAHSRSSAIRISEVENPGSPNEKEKKPGDDQGFLWRMETWWRLEEKDGGVYVQNQAVSLTRDIPTGLGWLIEPFINSIPRESLEFTLGATRRAVLNPKRD
jgi:hypothetical protein